MSTTALPREQAGAGWLPLAADFKRAIGEMRKRKKEEHELQKNQRRQPHLGLRSPTPVARIPVLLLRQRSAPP